MMTVKKNNIILRWTIKIGLFFICFFGAARFCKNQTGSFTVMRITSDLTPKAEWETSPLPPEELARVKTILNQPYSYLGRGVQCFVFGSHDGNYVIKFFRYDHLKPPFWSRWSPRVIAKKAGRLYKDFMSYKIAYDSLPQETGLVLLHLNKTTDFNQTLDLVDKLGIHHPIALDNYEFLIQKRATLLYPALDQMITEGRLDQAKETLTKLVHLLAHRAQKGIFDKDPDLNTNFGVVGTTPIQIDVGRFRRKPIQLDKDAIIRITDNLHQNLMKKCPELDRHLKHQIETL